MNEHHQATVIGVGCRFVEDRQYQYLPDDLAQLPLETGKLVCDGQYHIVAYVVPSQKVSGRVINRHTLHPDDTSRQSSHQLAVDHAFLGSHSWPTSDI